MLKNIKVTNFYSIGEEQEMSLEISAKDILDDSARSLSDNDNINLVSCIVGHNASGKTTILKAITFLIWFTQESYGGQKPEKDIPIEQHKLYSKKPTSFCVEFYSNSTLYKYSLTLTDKEVLGESLLKKDTGTKRFSSVFKLTRKHGKADVETRRDLKLNETDKTRFLERRNVSFFSCLANTGYLPELALFKFAHSNVTNLGLSENDAFSNVFLATQLLHKNKALRDEVFSFINSVDLGISDYEFHELPPVPGKADDETRQILTCHHSSKNGNFKLPVFEESNGTQQSLYILARALPIIKKGGIVVLDEIDAGLHPYVVKKIVSLFENKKTNPKNAQLIFSTHQHLLLNDRTKTQIFIAEKNNETFETELYRLDDIEGVRNDENYFHKYLAGAYGGIPKFKWV